jgi:hypothetical protein
MFYISNPKSKKGFTNIFGAIYDYFLNNDMSVGKEVEIYTSNDKVIKEVAPINNFEFEDYVIFNDNFQYKYYRTFRFYKEYIEKLNIIKEQDFDKGITNFEDILGENFKKSIYYFMNEQEKMK